MSGAETLRRAAALMRERAEAATGAPWVVGVVDDLPIVFDTHDLPEPVVYDQELTVANATHIASWHPAVARAVADWLDEEADLIPDTIEDQIGLGMTPEDAVAMAEILHCPAIAVARAYLGSDA